MATIFDRISALYLKGLIERGDATAKKRALQQLCQGLRKGKKIHPQDIDAMETCVVGVLWTQGSDPKVRRWALNAIAQFGREKSCRDAVVSTLKQYGDDPETAASAVAALFHLSKDANKFVRAANVLNEDVIVLAALQQVDVSKIEFNRPRIDIENTDPEVLKLALVVVGMDKAPQNLFHPSHSNAEIVKVLGGHDNEIVSQYSVWAITENDTLGLKDLGIETKDIEAQPANVRSWIYRLVATEADKTGDNFDLIELGASDQDAEARRGLTVGLKETFFDGLEPLVSDWLFSEFDPEVRNGLIDHIVRQSKHCAGYETLAIELYEAEELGSAGRDRMEAVASGTTLYGKFKQTVRQPELFEPQVGVNVTNNTFNINGNVAGVNSFGGNASNSGTVNAISEAQQVQIQEQLLKAEAALGEIAAPIEVKDAVRKSIDKAKKAPTKEAVGEVVESLKKATKVVDAGSKLAAAGAHLVPIIEHLGHLAGIG